MRRRHEVLALEAAAATLEASGQHVAPPLVIACPECGAVAGRRCLTRSGKPRKEPHRERDAELERERGRDAVKLLDEAHCAWLGIPYFDDDDWGGA
jgi:hypothetical protein